ncbi:GNAT family N-acetyltransferase [Saliniramus fredricksonii]|nr:GNAT family N-acetyltransferase [Saliniramus fredricksonii]
MMDAQCLIRRADPGDLDTLYDLFEEHAAYEGLPFSGHGRRDSLAAMMFEEPARIFGWVAVVDHKISGYMTATIDCSTWNASPFIYMDCLYLRERYRGLGLGRILVQELAAFARGRGCAQIQWHTPPDNALGIGFYRRIGASQLPKVRFFLDVPGDEVGGGN